MNHFQEWTQTELLFRQQNDGQIAQMNEKKYPDPASAYLSAEFYRKSLAPEPKLTTDFSHKRLGC